MKCQRCGKSDLVCSVERVQFYGRTVVDLCNNCISEWSDWIDRSLPAIEILKLDARAAHYASREKTGLVVTEAEFFELLDARDHIEIEANDRFQKFLGKLKNKEH